MKTGRLAEEEEEHLRTLVVALQQLHPECISPLCYNVTKGWWQEI
jgi:rubrerythrin